jgi:hypothetical protein
MRTPAPARKALAIAAFEAARGAADLRLRSGDKRRQPVDTAIIRNCRLWLLLRLWLWLWLGLKLLPAVFAMAAMFARLVLVALLVWLSVALVVACIIVAIVARYEGLRLHRNKAGLLPKM